MLRRPVRLVFLLLLATACTAAPPSAVGGKDSPRLRSGPMRGYAQQTEVAIWLQTTAPATVRIRYWPDGREASARLSQPVATESDQHVALLRLAGLTPGTRYAYEVLLGRGAPLRQPDWTFLTQTLWEARNPPPDFTVALGSCYFANDAASDPPRSKPYGGSPAIFERIADKRPDLMIWLGDNVYYREPDFGSAAALRERNALAREEPALRRLLTTASHYAIWDDHDFGPNNAIWTYPLAPAAEEAFRLYWANPTYGLPDIRGIFGLFSWADVDFFLLDGRTYRTPETAVPAESRRMLGDGQMRWLKDALLASEAPFKVIASGSQVLNALPKVDTLRLYPAEYRELLDWIVSNRIPGVLFVTGDKHHAELVRETPPGFYTLTDFTSSPLTSGMWLDRGEEVNPQRVADTLVLDLANFGLLKFSGPCNDRVLTLETWDVDGKLRWTHTLRARELTPPGTPADQIRGHPRCRWLKS